MVSTKALETDIEYPLRSNALSAKSVLGGRVALTTGSREIRVDIKSGECQQQTPDLHIGTCLGQVLRTDHNPIIDIGGDKDRMNKMTPYHGELVG